MSSDIKTCPTCGQPIKRASSIFKRILIGGITGITAGILFGAGAVFIDRNGIVAKRFIAGFGEKEFLSGVDEIIR